MRVAHAPQRVDHALAFAFAGVAPLLQGVGDDAVLLGGKSVQPFFGFAFDREIRRIDFDAGSPEPLAHQKRREGRDRIQNVEPVVIGFERIGIVLLLQVQQFVHRGAELRRAEEDGAATGSRAHAVIRHIDFGADDAATTAHHRRTFKRNSEWRPILDQHAVVENPGLKQQFFGRGVPFALFDFVSDARTVEHPGRSRGEHGSKIWFSHTPGGFRGS